VGSARFWLLLFLGQIVGLAALSMAGNFASRVPALQYLGIVFIVGIFACVPPAVLTSFVAAQARIGNGGLSFVRGVREHQVLIVLGVYAMIGVALVMAWPRIREDIREARAEAALGGGRADWGAAEPLAPSSSPAPVPAPAAPTAVSAVDIPVTTPVPGSREHAAILDALRTRLGTTGRFRVDHLKLAGEWAFVRATEVVVLEGGEEQETDLTAAALLELPRGSTTGWWRIADYWTLPEEERRPLSDFVARVQARLAAERVPAALLPDDLRER
jgi:hypothetical protein